MAPTRVAGDLYADIDGQMLEIKRQLRQREGYPYYPMRLVEHLQAAIEGNLVNRHGQLFAPFKYDKREEGWKLLEDVEFGFIDISNLELVPFLNYDENFVNGEEAVLRSRRLKANLGQRHAEYLLEHQDKIPHEFRKYVLVFTGTIWRDPVGLRYVAYLCHDDGAQWYLSFSSLGYNWLSHVSLLRPRE